MHGLIAKLQISLIAALFFAAAVSAQVTFVQQPAMVSNGSGGYTITFQVSQNADVEVSIVNVAQAKVIRHLAAGLLGATPPPPLTANSLSQTLTWDGKDDFGAAVANPQSLNVRVRAGSSPKLVNLALENLYSFASSPTVLTAPSGSVYIHGKACGLYTFIRKYDASGNYIKTIFPPSSAYPSDSMKGWGINILTAGWWVPKTNPQLGVGIQFAPYNPANVSRITAKGGIVFSIYTGGQYVMDTNGVFVDTASTALLKEAVEVKPAIAGVSPALVGVSKRTGAVYAVTNAAGSTSLAKYSVAGTAPSLNSKVALPSSLPGLPAEVVSMAVAETGTATNIFVASKNSGIRVYTDNGSGPKLLKEFAAFREGPYAFERIAVDRSNEHTYWNNAMEIQDWNNPVVRQMGMTLDNITVGPRGNIYGWTDGSVYNVNPIVRYASDNAHMPAPYGNTGANQATSGIYFEYGFAGTHGNHRGIAVGWQKQIAAFTEGSPLFQVPDTGGSLNTSAAGNNLVGSYKALLSIDGYTGYGDAANIWTLSRQMMNCVKYDPAGNFYVGIKKIPTSPIFPSGIATDLAFRNSGCVVKFSKDSVGAMDQVGANLRGYTKMYRQLFGPMTASATGGTIPGTGLTNSCTCRNSYFDVDPYGRLYIPNASYCQVSVVDNAGNTISAFGQYGNSDARGGLAGPGQTTASPAIPLAWPTSVAASEDFIYVADAINARLARVQMIYAIDNFPGLTTHTLAVEKGDKGRGFKITAAPNPFNPESRISIFLPAASGIDLKVYNVGGRLVRTLASENLSAGAHSFSWDAKDDAGRIVSAGMYLYKLTAGKQVMMEKTILAK